MILQVFFNIDDSTILLPVLSAGISVGVVPQAMEQSTEMPLGHDSWVLLRLFLESWLVIWC